MTEVAADIAAALATAFPCTCTPRPEDVHRQGCGAFTQIAALNAVAPVLRRHLGITGVPMHGERRAGHTEGAATNG